LTRLTVIRQGGQDFIKENMEEYIEIIFDKMKDLSDNGYDTERNHVEEDELLCDLLIKLGYEELIVLYNKINKWYA
jgi:hypothetical protein